MTKDKRRLMQLIVGSIFASQMNMIVFRQEVQLFINEAKQDDMFDDESLQELLMAEQVMTTAINNQAHIMSGINRVIAL